VGARSLELVEGPGSWCGLTAPRAVRGRTFSLDHRSGGTRLNTQGARYIVNACPETPG
jgi:hypothetical protein